MRENVLLPLGMDESSYEQPLPDDRISQACAGHTRGGKVIEGKRHIYPEQAAAGLWTTPSQLAKYCLAVQEINAGATGGVLTPDTVHMMLTSQNGSPAGLGPFMEEKGGHATFSHSGGNAGFSCLMYAYADQGKGAIVMTNSDSAGRLIPEIFDAIAEAYDWPGYLEPAAKALAVDDALAARYSGKYSLGPLGIVTVERRDDKLVAILPLQGEADLYLSSPTRFFTDREGLTGRFELDDKGNPVEMVLPVLNRAVHAKRLP
jgi:CubicO group peptidase (beta-lactamase class C family)